MLAALGRYGNENTAFIFMSSIPHTRILCPALLRPLPDRRSGHMERCPAAATALAG
jgi:hypothetical protein